MTEAMAITVFHRKTTGFDVWARSLLASAAAADGWVDGVVSVHDDSHLDCACAVTFRNEKLLHDWLDSPARAALLHGGEELGYWRSSTDLVLVQDSAPPAGVGAFRHQVAAGKESEFRSAQARLAVAGAEFPGYEGTIVLPPRSPAGEWLSLARFRTESQLATWMGSGERDRVLPGLRSSLAGDFTVVSNSTPFATVVRTENGRTLMTPNWKAAMLVLLVLYPTVMILSRFLGPVLDDLGAQPWLALWVSQIASVSLMQWWLMPAATRPFRRWLDPVDGAGTRISMIGAGAVIALYVVTLAVFALVKWLQYWDFAG